MSSKIDLLFEELFGDLKGRLQNILHEVIDAELAPYRALLIKSVSDDFEDGEEFVEALTVAEMIGYDTSTADKQKAARQKVYYLARTGMIPCTRISQRRIKFPRGRIKRWLAMGGVAHVQTPSDEPLASTLRH